MEKKLYKIVYGRKLCGVCGGFAEYLNLDANLIRVVWAVVSCFGGAGVLAYIVAALILPDKPLQIEEP